MNIEYMLKRIGVLFERRQKVIRVNGYDKVVFQGVTLFEFVDGKIRLGPDVTPPAKKKAKQTISSESKQSEPSELTQESAVVEEFEKQEADKPPVTSDKDEVSSAKEVKDEIPSSPTRKVPPRKKYIRKKAK